MNLADMLCYADIHELSRIALNYECECSSHSKHELIQSILMKIGRRDVFDDQIRCLSIAEIRFLNTLMFEPKSLFSLEELQARIKQSDFDKGETDGVNPREVISRFKQRGWLFNGFSQQTRYLFQTPQDVLRKSAETLMHYFSEQLHYTKEPAVYREEHQLLAEDMRTFLKLIRSEPVALAADGTMYKRSLHFILSQLAIKEEPLAKGGWRFGYGRHFKEYPNRFSLLYDYCMYKKLVEEKEGLLIISETGEAKLAEQVSADAADLGRYWLRLYKGPIPNLSSLVYWAIRLSSRWVSRESLGKVLLPLIKPYYYDTADSILNQRILHMLLHLGLIRWGEEEQSGQVLQATPLGKALIASSTASVLGEGGAACR
ncbi:hypothetical protein [Paenibacillus sp. y28]|uniref:hypothetical protein n=1 Tax=Paenibacillus sp. y28 TaxID=3129110 RepID=UPI0030193242